MSAEMSIFNGTRVLIKRALIPLIYRYPPCALAPERLAVYLHGLLARKCKRADRPWCGLQEGAHD